MPPLSGFQTAVPLPSFDLQSAAAGLFADPSAAGVDEALSFQSLLLAQTSAVAPTEGVAFTAQALPGTWWSGTDWATATMGTDGAGSEAPAMALLLMARRAAARPAPGELPADVPLASPPANPPLSADLTNDATPTKPEPAQPQPAPEDEEPLALDLPLTILPAPPIALPLEQTADVPRDQTINAPAVSNPGTVAPARFRHRDVAQPHPEPSAMAPRGRVARAAAAMTAPSETSPDIASAVARNGDSTLSVDVDSLIDTTAANPLPAKASDEFKNSTATAEASSDVAAADRTAAPTTRPLPPRGDGAASLAAARRDTFRAAPQSRSVESAPRPQALSIRRLSANPESRRERLAALRDSNPQESPLESTNDLDADIGRESFEEISQAQVVDGQRTTDFRGSLDSTRPTPEADTFPAAGLVPAPRLGPLGDRLPLKLARPAQSFSAGPSALGRGAAPQLPGEQLPPTAPVAESLAVSELQSYAEEFREPVPGVPIAAPVAATHATAPPVRLQLAPRASEPGRRIVAQLVAATMQRAELVPTAGSQRFHVRLDPPELGHMEIEIHRTSAGDVAVRVTALNGQTHALLERHTLEIAQSIEDQGLSLSQFDLAQQGSSREGRPFQEPRPTTTGDHNESPSSVTEEDRSPVSSPDQISFRA